MNQNDQRFGDGYFSRAVNNGWITIGRLMVGRTSTRVLESTAIKPVYASIMVTQNCNYKCLMCSFWHRHTDGELSASEIARVTGEMRSLGIAQINFTGGEPFLRNDLAEIVRGTAANDFAMIQVTTNASLATHERLEELLGAGMGRIAISCDGTGVNHETQRGVPGAWKKNIAALDALRKLRTTRYPKLEIEMAMVVSKQTMGDLGELLRLCEEYRAVLHLQFLDNVQFFTSEVNTEDYNLSAAEVDDIIEEAHRHLKGARGMDPLMTHTGLEYIRRHLKRQDPTEDLPKSSCGVGYAMCYVDSQGYVYPGCFAISPIGNVRDRPLREIVDSEHHRKVAQDMFRMNCPRCPNGYAWGVFTTPNLLVREVREKVTRRLPWAP